MTRGQIQKSIAIVMACIILVIIYIWQSPKIADAVETFTDDNKTSEGNILENNLPTPHVGKYVFVNLEKSTIELKDGTSTIKTMSIVSQGKPGSYYETIGGNHINDYKVRNHFSSIGHVYMPYSVHVFGNYFIHGIPYYPSGEKVSSTYSGGCIRLEDVDAEELYTFVNKGMPIIISRGDEYSFENKNNIKNNNELYSDEQMTKLMVATISLEVLTQDNEFTNPFTGEITTRRKLLPELLHQDGDSVARLYAESLGTETYLDYMNRKAIAIGLKDTTFSSVTSPVMTTESDKIKFMNYINTYKSYLLNVSSNPNI